jgi:hypothetical protein
VTGPRVNGSRSSAASALAASRSLFSLETVFAQRDEVSVDRSQLGAVDGMRNPVADPVHRRDVAPHSPDVAGRGVDEYLVRPELEAAEVDLGLRAVAKLEV